MDDELEDLCCRNVKKTYVKQGFQNIRSRKNLIKQLLDHKKMPKTGWDDNLIEDCVRYFSTMDSNNFSGNCGVGEREGRVFSEIVSRRHFYLSHGIGRSGDIAEVQPKAAGSSLMYSIATSLAHHAIVLSGITSMKKSLIVPLATGMTMSLCLSTMKSQNPAATFVIWPRIDQKSCFKAILNAGLNPIVVENILENGCMTTDVAAIARLIDEHEGKILCVLSTTSCFAPRQPDAVDKIAAMCREKDVGHLINNAYGLQCASIAKLINRACLLGRVDAVVQSTDKNFMVPVGGAVISSPTEGFIKAASAMYPGRASMTPVLDVFITLLSMGEEGYVDLLRERVRLLEVLRSRLAAIADKYGERVLPSPGNFISIGLSLQGLDSDSDGDGDHSVDSQGECEEIQSTTFDQVASPLLPPSPPTPTPTPTLHDAKEAREGGGGGEIAGSAEAGELAHSPTNTLPTPSSSHARSSSKDSAMPSPASPTFLGSMLFQRNVSGARVVAKSSKVSVVNGFNFRAWGAHSDEYPCSYLTAACAIGTTDRDINLFVQRLDACLGKAFKAKHGSSRPKNKVTAPTDATPDIAICAMES